MARQVSMQYGSKKNASQNKNREEWVLIWENDAPTSSFAAQVIPLDLSKYDWIRVQIRNSSSATCSLIQDLIVEEDGLPILFQMTNLYRTTTAAAAIYSYSRLMSATPTGLDVSDCSRRQLNTTSSSANSTQNGNMYPLRIWGKVRY